MKQTNKAARNNDELLGFDCKKVTWLGLPLQSGDGLTALKAVCLISFF